MSVNRADFAWLTDWTGQNSCWCWLLQEYLYLAVYKGKFETQTNLTKSFIFQIKFLKWLYDDDLTW